jgi:hypothetical protein
VPLAIGVNKTELGPVSFARAWDRNEPMAGFRLDVQFGGGLVCAAFRMDPNQEVLTLGLSLLFGIGIPMRVKTMGIARSQEHPAGPV